MHPKLSLVFAIASILGALRLDAQGSSKPYTVLSNTQVIVGVNCIAVCPSATLMDNQSGKQAQGAAQAARTGAPPTPDRDWTLVTFEKADSPFVSGHSYSLSILHADAGGKPVKPEVVLIDTAPMAQISPGAGAGTANLSSVVAFTSPGSASPLFNYEKDDECLPEKRRHQLAQSIQLPGLRLDFSATKLCEMDMTGLASGTLSVDPALISVVQGTFNRIDSSVNADTSPKRVQINGLSNVLGATPELDSKTALGQTKAPANKDAAWLWIDGTITAGTGTAPAWVLDGKLAPFITQLPWTTVVTWAAATANIGNNKVNGQTAKDVIDFVGPSLKSYLEGTNLGAVVSLAPTYETNLALNHRNMLAVVDIMWDWGRWNRTQFVRTALAHKGDLSKMPKAGDFKGGYATYGGNLHFHTGLEAGGALAAVVVTNSKTKKTVGTIPTYSIARFVPRIDGILQYWLFTFESDLTGRYLSTTETTAVNDKSGSPYLKMVSGWKAVNAGTFTFAPVDQHYGLTIGYTNGFSAPTYQRANGVKVGVQVKY